MRVYFLLFIVFVANTMNTLTAQKTVKGYVYSIIDNDKLEPLPGVHIQLLDLPEGTITTEKGFFSITTTITHPKLVVSFIGFETDTIPINTFSDTLRIVLKEGNFLTDVNVTYKKGDYYISKVDPINAHTMGQGELRKAACCSLAESFETNPSISANYTDAITGTKQIQMLGLSGRYVQIMQDNIPSIRGLTTVFGLDYIPGAWINSIQVAKGSGSVVNGFESITGQINLDMKKPRDSERMHLNLFAGRRGRLEANLVLDHPVGDHWETTLLFHGKNQQLENDLNNDNFLDQPLTQRVIARNEWKYIKNNLRMEYGFGGLVGKSKAGTLPNQIKSAPYVVDSEAKRVDGFAKIGYLFPENDYKSLAVQFAGSYYEYNGNFSNTKYQAQQTSGYFNSIFQNELSENQTFKTGLSVNYDLYDETIDFDNRSNYSLEEKVIGGYFEHTLTKNRFSIITGLRTDHNFTYGTFVTPRLHGRYTITENTIAKIVVGGGTRTPNIIMENIGLLATSRRWIINRSGNLPRYGLNQEKAWNFGTGINQEFSLNRRKGSVQFDAYHTLFTHQVVVDLDNSTREVNFYNLNGNSFASSLQMIVNCPINKRLDLRLAYRYLDLRTTYQSGELSLPFVARNRAFSSLSYSGKESEKGGTWKGELTIQWVGKQRIPSTKENPIEHQRATSSPDYFLINSQLTKVVNSYFEVYLGGENLTNYRQNNPIIQVSQPDGDYFDSSMVWGPIIGLNVYIGLRWTIP